MRGKKGGKNIKHLQSILQVANRGVQEMATEMKRQAGAGNAVNDPSWKKQAE